MCIFKRSKQKFDEPKTKSNNFHISVEIKACTNETPIFEKLSEKLSGYFDNYMSQRKRNDCSYQLTSLILGTGSGPLCYSYGNIRFIFDDQVIHFLSDTELDKIRLDISKLVQIDSKNIEFVFTTYQDSSDDFWQNIKKLEELKKKLQEDSKKREELLDDMLKKGFGS